MSKVLPVIRVGQFSESPVLALAGALNLGETYGISWTTERVTSSPSQFQSLQQGEIDIAITSPDNVMLYGTTSKNPLQTELELELLRPIDRGMGLALYSAANVEAASEFNGAKIGVDVPNSGFAFLLLAMLAQLGVDTSSVKLESIGATPRRLAAVQDGAVSATILNAETALAAEASGLKKWATSVDVSQNYLGTVLAQLQANTQPAIDNFLKMWSEATEQFLYLSVRELADLLKVLSPALANPEYLRLAKSQEFGLIQNEPIRFEQLKLLAEIRSEFGAYVPSDESLEALVRHG